MKKWVNKHDVMRWCSIRPTTYKKRLKNLSINHRVTGYRGETLINHEVVYSHFCDNHLPIDDLNSIVSYSHSVSWSFIGNVIPVCSTATDLKNKIQFLFELWILEDPYLELVFSTEPNTKDKFHHSHFLIKTSLSHNEILKGLTLVCDDNNIRESRIHLRQFKPNRGSGVNYTLKDLSKYIGYLSNDYCFLT